MSNQWMTSHERNKAVGEFQQRLNVMFVTGYDAKDDFTLEGERFDWSQEFADARHNFRNRMNGPWGRGNHAEI